MGAATDESLMAVEQEVTAVVDDAVAFAEESPLPEPIDALDHVFWTDPEGLEGL
jgi:TPP-dependent pyruvate/acetoin dehydrogenase alpha subunit